jgi:translocation and assembly module TamB
MRRKYLLRLVTVFLVLFLVFVALAAWLLGTATGARWLIGVIARHYSVNVTIEEVHGRVWDALSLEGLHVRWEDGSLDADHLILNWKPVQLLTERNIVIETLDVRGKDITLNAKGDLNSKIIYLVNIPDLKEIINDSQGFIHGEGWIRRKLGNFEGEVSVKSHDLMAYGISFQKALLNGSLRASEGLPVDIRAEIDDLEYSGFQVQSSLIEVNGTLSNHTIEGTARSDESFIQFVSQGSYQPDGWSGMLERLESEGSFGLWFLEKPARLEFSSDRLTIDHMTLKGKKEGHLTLNVSIDQKRREGSIVTEWAEIELRRISQWLTDVHMSGKTSGIVETAWEDDTVNRIYGKIDLSGRYRDTTFDIPIKRADLFVEGGRQGLTTSLDVEAFEEGLIKGRFDSSLPVHFDLPEDGEINLRWQHINLSAFQPLLPEELIMEGSIDGNIEGALLTGHRVDLKGTAVLTRGTVSHTIQKGRMEAEIQSAEATFAWREKTLTGEMSVLLSDRGALDATITLPLLAGIPITFDHSGRISGTLEGTVKEHGLLTAFFPGVIQETEGEFRVDLSMDGTWKNPLWHGTMQLEDATAYLPSAGIRLEDVRTIIRFDKERIIIDTLSARSGEGILEGKAEIQVSAWKVSRFKGNISGENFRTVYLPEIQIYSSPSLTFSGGQEKLSIQGEILIPELVLSGYGESEAVQPSEDVVLIDDRADAQKEPPLMLDIQLRIILGEKVSIRTEGIKTQLTGDVNISGHRFSDMNGRGLIEVQQGTYKRYGVDLNITRGRIVFSGGPIQNPSLDILAVRTVGDVTAGIAVSGTVQMPVVTLYSVPSMTDTDILAYIVLGRPLGSDKEGASLVFNAANILLSESESASLQEQIRDAAGLDVLEIESEDGDVAHSILTVGKYLTPELYVSYGQSLIGERDVLRLRYIISRHWEIETTSGTFSGVDVFYKISFR